MLAISYRRNILRCMLLGLMLCAPCLLWMSCTQDNVHIPSGGEDSGRWETYTASYSGTLTTTVPQMQEYLQGPVISHQIIEVGKFHSSHSGYVTVCTKSFSINDPFILSVLGKAIEIGAMEISDVEYAAFPTGGGYLKKDNFDIQAGDYRTRGSLQGMLSSTGKLSLVIRYRPGTMPFEIVSEFETTQ